MRLAQDQTRTILEAARRFVGAEAGVLVFGSRVDDALKGGDVDLMIEAPERPIHRIARLTGVRLA